MTLRIALKSALVGLEVSVAVLLVLGAGFSGKETETYRLNMIPVGQEIICSRTNTSTGQVEMWRYTLTQIPYYRDGVVLREPKY